MELTRPQQNVIAFIHTVGNAASVTALREAGLDVCAANNLVKKGVLKLEDGFYSLVVVPHGLGKVLVEETAKEQGFVPPVADTDVPAPTEAPEWTKSKEPYRGSPAAAKARALEVKSPSKVAPVVRTSKICLCGCGESTKSSFRIGHDMKLHSAVNRAVKAKELFAATVEQAEWLATKVWAKGKYEVTR